MPLVTPDVPEYGPQLFTELAQLVTKFRANDDYLKGLIDGIPSGIAQSSAAVGLAAGYAAVAGQAPLRVYKTGALATLVGGMVTCPATITAGAWITIGTVPAGFRPPTGEISTAVGILRYGAVAGQDYLNVRITADGLLQMLPWSAYSSAAYIVLPSGLGWRV